MTSILVGEPHVGKGLSDSRLANLSAGIIFDAFVDYQNRFLEITRRACRRFEQRDWRGAQSDSVERLDLYKLVVDPTVAAIHVQLDDRLQDKLIWAGMKAVYSGLIAARDDWELAETFFNSVTRRIFTTVGVDPHIEFVDTDFDTPPTQAQAPVYRTFGRMASTADLVEAILSSFEFTISFYDLGTSVRRAEDEIGRHLKTLGALQVVERTEVVASVFYRGKGAYIVGRMYSGVHNIPLVLALLNTSQGLSLDAVLLEENEVSILFSFARSYFHIEASRPHDLVLFLRSIMPRKKIAELYISIGHNKHGKTELYRDLLKHLAQTDDRFDIAPGERGMVMVVFTMPSYDMVFKVIKDHIAYPKNTSRSEVKGKYRLVFKHDRAGRLIDAQEFEHLKFDRRFFTPELLNELQVAAPKSVTVDDEAVIISHLYTERRLTPLDIYVRDADGTAAQLSVLDYGNAIKDLAATNIFPGDILLKNFGVTRHGRVVFYDYDELCLLTDCNFRELPAARVDEEELSAEPWFYVADNDIFPEEFLTFLGLQGELRVLFNEMHADLFSAGYWRSIQERIREGEVIDLFPYDQRKRLCNRYPTPEGGVP